MLSADESKSAGKAGQRSRKKKAGKPPSAGEQTAVGTERLQEAWAEISQEINREINREIDQKIGAENSVPAAAAEAASGEVSAIDVPARLPVVAAAPGAVGLHTIADAYGDYARKSLEEAWSFLEQLAAARSPAAAFALQMEFSRHACATFVTEAQRIGALHGELAMQRLMRFEGFVTRFAQTTLALPSPRH